MTEPADAAVAAPARALWSFALAAYDRPGVTSACLTLQDRDGVDVCLLLASIWAGRVGHRPDPSARLRLRTMAGHWNTTAVTPVRAARRALRRVEHPQGDVPPAAVAEAARRLGEVELSLERAQLVEMAEAIARTPATRGSRARARRLARLMAGCRDRRLLGIIVRAAFSLPDDLNRHAITLT